MVDIVSQTDACGNGGAGSSDFQLVVQNHGPVVPQLGAYINKKYGPGQGAQYGKDDEFRQRELGDTGRKGNKGAYPRQQAAGENGNGTIISNQSLAAIIFLAPRPPLAVCFKIMSRPPLAPI